MDEATAATLRAECDSLCRMLISRTAPDAIQTLYARAHASGVLTAPSGRRDRALLAIAHRAPRLARACDGVAAVVGRRGAFRRKVVLLLALLESHPETVQHVRWAPSTTLSRLRRLMGAFT